MHRPRPVFAALLVALLLAGLAVAMPQTAAADTITTDDLRTLLETGTSEAEIIRIVRSASAVRVAENELDDLARRGASEKLLAEIRARIAEFTLDKVLQLLAAGTPEAGLIDRILSEGRRFALSAEAKLQLRRAGASLDVLRALEGDYVIEGYRQYVDPLAMIAVQHPADWREYVWYTADGVKVLLSPETTVAGPNRFTTGLQIQLSFLDRGSPLRQTDGDIYREHINSLDALIRLNRGYDLAAVSEPVRARLAGRPAVEQVFDATMMQQRCRELMVKTFADDVYYFAEFIAPIDRYAELEPVFRRIRATMQPFPHQRRLTRRAEPVRANDLLEMYRAATVMIYCDWGPDEQGNPRQGSGSGFFVREDGFILTNHHVVTLDDDPDRVPQIEVIFDSNVTPGEPRRRLAVELVDRVRIGSPLVDMALLRAPVPREPYPTIPLCPVSSGLVREGDHVVALGFPLPGEFGFGNLVLTEGSISRLIEIEQPPVNGSAGAGDADAPREYDYALLDLTINPGNSGGPAINAQTGGVIGLNTAVPHARTWGEVERLDYADVSLIDYALEYFPQIRWYRRDGRTGPSEQLELGAMLLAAGNLHAARVQLAAALAGLSELDPDQRARLHHQLYLWFARSGNSTAALQSLDQSLADGPDYVPALRDRAFEYAAGQQLEKAAPLIDRMIRVSPDDWVARYHQAEIYRQAARYNEALAALDEATHLGGDYDPALHVLRARVQIENGELDAGEASIRRALEVAPDDVPALLLMADHRHRAGNDAAALTEYHRVIARFPRNAAALEATGRFEQSLDRNDDALDHLAQAILLQERAGERPYPRLLLDAANLALRVPGSEVVAVHLARRLRTNWPDWKRHANAVLADFWTAANRAALSRAHCLAANRAADRTMCPIRTAPQPLAFDDLVAALKLGYVPEMLIDMLGETSLGFQLLERETLEALAAAGLNTWQAGVLARRYQLDQTQGSAELAGLIELKVEGGVHVDDPAGPWVDLTLTNTGTIPLTGIRLRKRYLDGEQSELWHSDGELRTADTLLLPGESRRVRLRLNRWSTLAKHQLDAASITHYSVEVTGACNATFLGSIAVTGGVTDAGYELRVGNATPFALSEVQVLIEFVDDDGKPVRDAAGRAVTDWRRMALQLAPGTRSDAVRIAEWTDWTHLRRLGIPPSVSSVNMRVTVVDAVATIVR